MIKRRDILAGLGLAPLGIPFPARAAFAKPVGTAVAADTVIARLAIYPPLGISRVGNSAEWFLAPEVAGMPPLSGGRYKDAEQKVKKQVQRFRVYAFNADGMVIREITSADASITWRVHVANTKAAWYGFNNPLDNGDLAPGLPSQKRNQSIVDERERAEMLVIDPGAKVISGADVNGDGDDPTLAMVGRFWRCLEVRLGHLRTDPAGRLLVFPADGVSQSAVPDNPIRNFSDNDGWYDDWCDGVVQATVRMPGALDIVADSAWVACCGPDYAPEIPPFISLYDVISDVSIAAGWSAPPEPPLSFSKFIYPLFRRLALMEWVSAAHSLLWNDVGRFADPAFVHRLGDASPANRQFRETVLAAFRNPRSDDIQQDKLPHMLGDGVNFDGSPLRWFRIPDQQYAILQAWAEGLFLNDSLAEDHPVADIEDLPLSEQPESLTRAALEPCSGGAFHPGVELTWPLRHKELYSSAFRVALAANRPRDLVQDLGQLLTPEVAFAGYRGTPPAIAPQMPGDLTRWMGVPWQGDAFSCQQVVFANDFPNAAWWPALLPIDVLPERYYNALMNSDLAPAERVKFAEQRVAWSRGVAGTGYHANASYTDGLNRMVWLWDRMGFVVSRAGPKDPGRPRDIPSVLYVEVDRGSMDMFSVSQRNQKRTCE